MRRTALLAGLAGCAGLIAGCSSSSSTSSTSSETKPTYAQAEATAKQLLPANSCQFKVDDKTTADAEDKTLKCLTTVSGQAKEYSVFQYTRKKKQTEADQYFGGFTTATAYFQNGNITADPEGQSEPGQPVLDAPEFAAALKQSCGCGEVKTPTK